MDGDPGAWEPILTLEEVTAVNEKKGNINKRRYTRDGSGGLQARRYRSVES
jgi:hypothetical protein